MYVKRRTTQIDLSNFASIKGTDERVYYLLPLMWRGSTPIIWFDDVYYKQLDHPLTEKDPENSIYLPESWPALWAGIPPKAVVEITGEFKFDGPQYPIRILGAVGGGAESETVAYRGVVNPVPESAIGKAAYNQYMLVPADVAGVVSASMRLIIHDDLSDETEIPALTAPLIWKQPLAWVTVVHNEQISKAVPKSPGEFFKTDGVRVEGTFIRLDGNGEVTSGAPAGTREPDAPIDWDVIDRKAALGLLMAEV
jgi:hypothetical protein